MAVRWLHSGERRLKLNGRDVTVFVLSLLLAFSIWLIHNLSLNYNEVVTVPLVARSNLEGHAQLSSNTALVSARCRTTGYDLIRMKRASDRHPIEVVFAPADLHPAGGESFYVTSSDLNRYLQVIFGDNASLEAFLSDTLTFRFPFENSRKVPVQPLCTMDFQPQYTTRGGLKLEPDSVVVYGEPSRLAQIDRIYTKSFSLTSLHGPVHGTVALDGHKGLRLSETAVSYSVDVSRYVEVRATLPVQSRNVPSDRRLIVYPTSAEVLLRCAFPMGVDPTSGLDLYVDYHDFIGSLNGRCLPRLGTLPEGVLGYSVRPPVFECVESLR